ncbi:response regulator [Acetobacteraceae bacterium H6797]|nr:response regulator [Acetobacteraceae bacterium H6797]
MREDADVNSSSPAFPTILVVEDDYLIRLNISDSLADCGWHIVDVASADEARAVLETGVPVALVFSDIQMPGRMNGLGLAQWIRENRPEIRIILTSGGISATEVAAALCDEGPIPKPYNPQRIAERIRHHLCLGDDSALAQ